MFNLLKNNTIGYECGITNKIHIANIIQQMFWCSKYYMSFVVWLEIRSSKFDYYLVQRPQRNSLYESNFERRNITTVFNKYFGMRFAYTGLD